MIYVFTLYLPEEKKEKLYLLRKHINKYMAFIILIATLTQLGTIRGSVTSNQIENKLNSETTLIESSNNFNSPCNLENSLKKLERASQKESTDFKTFRSTDFFYSDETVRKIQLKLAYSFNIIDELKLNQLTLNHLDLRSPPQFI